MIGTTGLMLDYRLNAPSALILALGTLVSLCFHICSVGYMTHDEHPAGHQGQACFFALDCPVHLHGWLPDAMEGTTPVSVLIHAATTVAAGMFVVVRTYPICG